MAQWVVWRITNRNFEEAARFSSKFFAEMYAENMNKCHDSIRFQVTRVGETPVW